MVTGHLLMQGSLGNSLPMELRHIYNIKARQLGKQLVFRLFQHLKLTNTSRPYLQENIIHTYIFVYF